MALSKKKNQITLNTGINSSQAIPGACFRWAGSIKE
jgi:hypothetical protein